MSLLTRKGYTIGIDELTELDIDELTVTPKAFHPDPFRLRAQGRSEPLRTFEVFLDNDEGTVAVPRYWGEHKFGLSGKISFDVHEADNLAFEGELGSELQQKAANASIKQLRKEKSEGRIVWMTGFLLLLDVTIKSIILVLLFAANRASSRRSQPLPRARSRRGSEQEQNPKGITSSLRRSRRSVMSLLTRKGYTIGMDELTESDIEELTVTPKVFHPDEPLRTFEIFSDNDDGTVAVPRYWGESKFGFAGTYACDVHEAKNLMFEGTLRSESKGGRECYRETTSRGRRRRVVCHDGIWKDHDCPLCSMRIKN